MALSEDHIVGCPHAPHVTHLSEDGQRGVPSRSLSPRACRSPTGPSPPRGLLPLLLLMPRGLLPLLLLMPRGLPPAPPEGGGCSSGGRGWSRRSVPPVAVVGTDGRSRSRWPEPVAGTDGRSRRRWSETTPLSERATWTEPLVESLGEAETWGVSNEITNTVLGEGHKTATTMSLTLWRVGAEFILPACRKWAE